MVSFKGRIQCSVFMPWKSEIHVEECCTEKGQMAENEPIGEG
jgi:hypothetical protein